MKTFTSAFSLTCLLASLVAATPIAAPSTVAVTAASNGTAATCQCEAVICVQSWPEVRKTDSDALLSGPVLQKENQPWINC